VKLVRPKRQEGVDAVEVKAAVDGMIVEVTFTLTEAHHREWVEQGG
jgi:hypothetical protein